MTTSSPFPIGSAVIAYLRDSGGDEQDLSVAQQRSFVETWCADNHLHLTRVFTDIAAPGSSTIGRAGFLEMIHHFHQEQITERGVILWKFSRFSRAIDDSQFYRADLRRRGYIVYSINDNIPDSSNGRVLEALIDWMNARFLEDLSLDVKRGLHHNLQKFGTLPGTPPRGFKREQITIGARRDGSPHIASRWVPDPDYWDACARAWELRARGVPVKTIHLETRLFTALNSYTTFFTNRLYLGELVYGDTTIPNYAPAMITLETWNAVQSLNRAHSEMNNPFDNTHHPRRANSSFLLSGILYCARCGSIMSGKSKVTRDGYRLEYYYCARSRRNLDCDARPIPKLTIEDLALQGLRDFILDPKIISENDRQVAGASIGAVAAAQKARKRVTSQIGDLSSRISNVLDKIEAAASAPQSLVERLQELEDQRREKQLELDRMKSIENQETVYARTPEQAAIISDRIKRMLETDDFPRKRAIFQSCFSKILAERDGNIVRAMLHYWNPEDSDHPPNDGMTTPHSSVEAPFHRHTFTLPLEAKIHHLYS